MNLLPDDLRTAFRQFTQAPLLTLTAVVSLAAALGAGTLLFSIVQSLMLSPVKGIPQAERMVEIGRTTQSFGFDSLSLPNLRDLDQRLESADAVYGHSAMTMNLATGNGPVRVSGRMVTGGYFEALRVVPDHGRPLQRLDDRPGSAARVAVISHGLFRDRFGGDASQALGTTLRLNDVSVEVVGIAPPGFDHPGLGTATEVFVPIGLAPALGRIPEDAIDQRGSRWMMAGARIADGRSLASIESELDAVGAAISTEHPVANGNIGYTATPMRALPSPARGPVSIFVGLLFALVAIVLLVATFNVASLLLARGESRRREIAMRFALGAGRGRLLRQLMIETLLLVATAAVIGACIAFFGRRLFERIELPAPLPPLLDLEIQFSPAVMAFIAGAIIIATLLAGLFPAWRTTRAEPSRELAGSGRTVGDGRLGFRASLTGLQVAFSLLLLVLAGLFVSALQRAGDIDIGYRIDEVFVAGIDLRRIGYDHAERVALVERYIDAAATNPAFQGAAAASVVPLSQSRQGLGNFMPTDGQPVETDVSVVAGDFFGVLDIAVRGRKFDERDRFGGEGVVIINETLAERLAPGGNAIGQLINYGQPGDSRPLRIIGVAPDARYASLSDTGISFAYLPYAQTPGPGMHMLVRSGAGLQTVDQRLAAIQQDVDPNLLRPRVSALADVASISLLPQKIAGGLATALGLLGCGLAAIGLYGMLAQLVAAHAQEIGVRKALGASPAAIRRRIAWVGGRPAIIGALVGCGLAAVAARLLDGFLFGVRGADGVAFVGALVILALVCAAALVQPTLRAARIVPSEALRDE